MAKIDERKESIRNQILTAAKTYSEELAGKTFKSRRNANGVRIK